MEHLKQHYLDLSATHILPKSTDRLLLPQDNHYIENKNILLDLVVHA